MSNKHLLQTRLNSIQHYTEELRKLSDAAAITKSTKADIVTSMVEFFPFEKGDIIMNLGGYIRKIAGNIGAGEHGVGDIRISYDSLVLNGDNWRDGGRESIKIIEFENWKKIN